MPPSRRDPRLAELQTVEDCWAFADAAVQRGEFALAELANGRAMEISGVMRKTPPTEARLEQIRAFEECREFLDDCLDHGLHELAAYARARAIELHAMAYRPRTEFERDCYEAMCAGEVLAALVNGTDKPVDHAWGNLTGGRLVARVERLLADSAYLDLAHALADNGVPHCSLEALVLRYPSRFSEEALAIARKRKPPLEGDSAVVGSTRTSKQTGVDDVAPIAGQFDPAHLARFLDLTASLSRPQPPNGQAPAAWAATHLRHLRGIDAPLPSAPLDRRNLRGQCHGQSVLHAYVCVMAWVGQRGSRYSGHSANSWHDLRVLKGTLLEARNGLAGRLAGYNLFSGGRQVKGLGPASFTALLTFIAEGPKPFYIMEPWSGLAVNLLCGRDVVKLDRGIHRETGRMRLAVSRRNSGEDYEAYCGVIDELTEVINGNCEEYGRARSPSNAVDGDYVQYLLSGKDQPWRDYVLLHPRAWSHR